MINQGEGPRSGKFNQKKKKGRWRQGFELGEEDDASLFRNLNSSVRGFTELEVFRL